MQDRYIESILEEREATYGAFEKHANISQKLKEILHQTPNWYRLKSDQQEALEMVMHKVARILNGDPDYEDSWDDIGGYTQLVSQRLRRVKEGIEKHEHKELGKDDRKS